MIEVIAYVVSGCCAAAVFLLIAYLKGYDDGENAALREREIE